jgi:hypothetical protein
MTRTRPRRNCYRDALWVRAVVRSWAARLGHLDLDRAFCETLREDPMNSVSIEVVLAGKNRSYRLPTAVPGNAAAAAQRVDHLAEMGEIIPATAERALSVLAAIERVSPHGKINTSTRVSVPASS